MVTGRYTTDNPTRIPCGVSKTHTQCFVRSTAYNSSKVVLDGPLSVSQQLYLFLHNKKLCSCLAMIHVSYSTLSRDILVPEGLVCAVR